MPGNASPPSPDQASARSPRRLRDHAARRRPPPPPPPAPEPGHPTLDDVAARGHHWLRFPQPWEARFQADSAASRRLLLLVCAIVGIAGFWIGSSQDVHLVPDLTQRYPYVRPALLAIMVGSLALVLLVPGRFKRNWHLEALTSLNLLAIGLVFTWMALFTRHVTGFTHTAGLFGVIMYAGIAARQRFWWILGTTLISVGAYAGLARGHTPQQQLIVHANVTLIVLASVCTLVANYVFEYLDRRVWLLRLQGEARREALSLTRQTLNELSMRDPLTGLHNRRPFDAELRQAWTAARRGDRTVSLLLADVDFFKRYNDHHGHPAGDACLQQVARILADVAQACGGLAARLGGEEFVILMTDLTPQQACDVGETLCRRVREAAIPHRASSVSACVTLSVGVATSRPDEGEDCGVLVARADRALYAAKEGGRNRVAQASEAPTAQPAGEDAPPADAPRAPAELASPAVHAAPAGHEAEQDELLHALRHPLLRWLAFPPALEARYQALQAGRRRWHLLIAAALGLLTYNAYIHATSDMMADIADRLLTWQLILVPPMLVAIVAASLLRVPPRLREALYAIGASVLAVMTTAMLAQSHLLTALAYTNALVLIPLFACIAARQPFWFACIPCAATVASLGLLSAPDETARLVLRDSIFMVVNGTIYTLIAAYTLEYGARRQWLVSEIGRLQGQALEAATSHLRSLSTRDPLTGMSNRRHFEQRFTQMWDEGRILRRPVSLLIIDVDHFKAYNDGYGHTAGDNCLKQLALILQGVAAHEEVMAARLGGEEFAVLLGDCGVRQALSVGERLCAAVRNAGIEHRYSPGGGHLTISVGAASLLPESGLSNRRLMTMADEALYKAKTSGRDRACAQAGPPPPAVPETDNQPLSAPEGPPPGTGTPGL